MNKEQSIQGSSPKRLRLIAILGSLLGGILILVIKLYAAHISDSSALRSDALEGTVNVLAAAFGLGSLIFAEKPADEDHPYGHGKIEYFAQAFEGGLISLAGFLILIDTVIRIFHHSQLDNLGLGLKLNFFAGALNGVLGVAIYWSGKKFHSQILVADGIHLLTDLVTTFALGLGLVLVLVTGWNWLDPVIAIAVALFLFRTGFMLVQESSQALLDAQNPKLVHKIVDFLNEIPRKQVITAHGLKVQEFGRDKHVDLHLVVPEYLTVKEAHDATEHYAYQLREKLGHDSIVHTHVDPCERMFCTQCPMEDCKIRVKPYKSLEVFSQENIIKPG